MYILMFLQWMEKSSGGYVFRNALQEQRASKKYSDEKHSKMERIYEKIRQDYENSCSSRGVCCCLSVYQVLYIAKVKQT